MKNPRSIFNFMDFYYLMLYIIGRGKQYLKRLLSYAILFFVSINLIALPTPTGKYYGGRILFRNASSYDVSFEFDIAENRFSRNSISRFSIEKQDAIVINYVFFVPFSDEYSFNINSSLPHNYFKNIRIYNMGTGALLTEINPSDAEIFVLVEGNIENYDAIITCIVNNSLF